MSMLIEKRNELTAKLTALENARQAEIDAKVAEYRTVLETQMSTEQIDKVKNVISALDEVIKYESAQVSIAQPVQPTVEARPGMSTVFTPSRS